MAKLSAHGTEVLRVEKDMPLSEGTVCTTTRVLMSDGALLQKDMFRRTDGTHHGSGWKLMRSKFTGSPADWWAAKQAENVGWRRA